MVMPETVAGVPAVFLGEAALGAGLVAVGVASWRRVLAGRAAELVLFAAAASAVGVVLSMDALPSEGLRLVSTDPFSSLLRLAVALALVATAWLGTRPGADDAAPESWSLVLVSALAIDVAALAVDGGVAAGALAAAMTSTALWVAVRGDHVRAREQGLALAWQVSAAVTLAVVGLAALAALGGSAHYATLASRLPAALAAPGARSIVAAATALVLVAFAMPASAAPWLRWRALAATPAAGPVAAWLATGPLLLATALMVRFSRSALGVDDGGGDWDTMASSSWADSAVLVAAATALAPAVAALRSGDLGAILAWITTAQAGWLVAALAAGGNAALGAGLVHVAATGMAAVGAAASIAPLVEHGGHRHLELLRGLARRRGGKAGAAVVVVFFGSLAGLPPLGGWQGHAAVVAEVLRRDHVLGAAALAVASVLLGVAVLRVVVMMLDRPVDPDEAVPVDFETAALAALLVAGVVALGVAPGGLAAWLEATVAMSAR